VNPTLGAVKYGVGVFLLLISLVHCGEPLPTTNPVQTIEVNQLDNKISQMNFSGLVVAVASWCPPCRKELPILAKLYRKYNGKGLQIMAVSVDAEGPKAVQPLINELKIPFPVYWVGTQAIRHYELVGVPTLMIYDNGRPIEKLSGSQSKKTIESKIKALLTGSG
jgi:thiol-disulfide isomerase/thioredoxin